MEVETHDEFVVDKLALFLLNHAFLDFAAAIRRAEGTTARGQLQRLEYSIATTLFRFWTETEAGRACPAIIAATALRIRTVLRDGREPSSAIV
jgi:hypothetical protein